MLLGSPASASVFCALLLQSQPAKEAGMHIGLRSPSCAAIISDTVVQTKA